MTQEMGALIAAIRKIADNITPTGGGGGISDIGGMIEAGTNTTLTGSGSLADPYVINADTSGTWFAPTAVIPTRASADDPTYTITFAGVDLTNIISEGFRISWKQNALTRYGFISKAPTYSAGNTTVTILTICGDASANYDVLDTGTYAISEVKFSAAKSPLGFPMDTALWTTEVTSTTNAGQASPTANTWYNPSISIVVPIGLWDCEYSAELYGTRSTIGQCLVRATLATANNSETDNDFRTEFFNQAQVASIQEAGGAVYKRKTQKLTAKTTYYLNIGTSMANITNVLFVGANQKTIIRATCKYL